SCCALLRPRCPALFPYTTLFRSGKRFHAVGLNAFGTQVWMRRCRVCPVPQCRRCLAGLLLVLHLFCFALCLHGLNALPVGFALRSEEHTSELQSRVDIVCRLLLE